MKMEKLKAKRTSRRSLNSRIINEASALFRSDSAMHEQLDSIYERLKANNNELNKINVELESLITDEEFQAEYKTVLQYEDNATRTFAELMSRRDRISSDTAHAAEGSTSATHTIASPLERTKAKLPKLTITPFSLEMCVNGWSFGSNLTRLFTTMQALPPVRSFIICNYFLKETLLQRSRIFQLRKDAIRTP